MAMALVASAVKGGAGCDVFGSGGVAGGDDEGVKDAGTGGDVGGDEV
ncbi:hypothetical protein AGMMS49936_10480 [Endomicrobiia bacterium]|nr:hypothetical protein AGMMS49936_10480 [Endomicrobiia bacterium]